MWNADPHILFNIHTHTSPEWAARNVSLPEQYTCAVCTAHRQALTSGDEAVWVVTLSNTLTFAESDVEAWAASLGGRNGVRLDQLVVSPSGGRYLFVLAAAKAMAELLAAAEHLLAAQPFPPELKVSPRVADPAALETATANSSAAAPFPSSSSNESVTTLHIQTMVSDNRGGGSQARTARWLDGVEQIRAALGLPLSSSSTTIHRASHDDDSISTSSSASNTTMCANCTVEAGGNGVFVVSKIPVPMAGQAAHDISRALSSALVIDLARPFHLFNKEAAFQIQSGTDSRGPGAGTPLWDRGLTGASEIIGVVDSGLDHSSCFFHDSDHPVFFEMQVCGMRGEWCFIHDCWTDGAGRSEALFTD